MAKSPFVIHRTLGDGKCTISLSRWEREQGEGRHFPRISVFLNHECSLRPVAAVLSIVLGCAGLFGCRESAGTPDLGGASQGRLRVAHGKLLDGKGRPTVLRGLSFGAIWSIKGLGRWDEAHFAHARSWGAELVRAPVFPFTFRMDREQVLRDLDDAVLWCERQNLYLAIVYHVMGNISKGQLLYSETSSWEEITDFWTTVAARYADRPTVAFADIYTEPASLDLDGWAWSDWRSHADELVAVLRKNAPKMIPVLGGLNFAYDFSAGGDKPFSDPDIVLAAHPFPGAARASRRASWDANFGYLGQRYPFLLEFGFDPDDPGSYRGDLGYGRDIVGYAAERAMSWTAYVFHNEEGWPMPLFTDWETLTPTLEGQFFKDVLAGQGLDIAGSSYVPVDAGVAEDDGGG
jgi:endoglucanase